MSNVVQMPPRRCPDCAAPWPRAEDRCPGCLLSHEELEAAAAFIDELERRASS